MVLKEIRKGYILQPETDFAVLVDGPWGSGKTHFIKKEVGPLISGLQCSLRNEKGEIKQVPYELVYVSLFGMGSLDDLQRRLFTEVNPILKTKVAKGTMLVVGKVMDLFNVGEDEGDSTALMNILGGIKRNKVLVFDDLERLSDDLLNEVMGFINTYTEHQGLKVIIIAHEDIISKKVKDYGLVKEKLIRFTYTYAPDLPTVLPTFLSRYDDHDFTTFVDTCKQILLRCFEKGEHINLRTLRFFLDLFFAIFSEVKKVQELEEEARVEMLQRFFFFLLTYCIEYKKHGIDDAKKQELKDLGGHLEAGGLTNFFEALDELNIGDEQQRPQQTQLSFIRDFEKRYVENSGQTFRYYEFIVQYVCTGDLETTDLEKECRWYNSHITAIRTQPEFAAFHKLENCLLLEDEEFRQVYQQVLNAAFNGVYPLEIYPKVFEIITNCTYNGIHGVTINEELIRNFKAGMDRSIVGRNYTGVITFMTSTDHVQLKEIRNYAKRLNESLLEKQNQEISAVGLEMFRDADFDTLEPFLQTEMAHITIFREPVFEPDFFVQRFLDLKNLQKRKCIEVVQRTFERFSHRQMDQQEVRFWNLVYNLLDARMPPALDGNTMSSISIRDMMAAIRSFVPAPEVVAE